MAIGDICHGMERPPSPIMGDMSRTSVWPRATASAPSDQGASTEESSGSQIGLDRLWRFFWWSSVGLVYGAGAFVVVAIVATQPAGPAMASGVVGAAAASLASGRLLDLQLRRSSHDEVSERVPFSRSLILVATLGALATIVAAQSASNDPAWAIVPGLATGAVAVTFPRRFRTRAIATGVAASVAVAALASYGFEGSVDLSDAGENAVLVALVAAALVSGRWAWNVVARLDRSRRLEADLAVADERLRFAADLHDVQGHHLQVIALESELAKRLVADDPRAAESHIQRVHEHARTALVDTRSLVYGYRRVSLGDELANATGVLAAAEIDGRLAPGTEAASGDIPERQRHLLGLVVREATTNILRHSRATRARLALSVEEGTARLEVRNDGVSAEGTGPATGLATLADRLGDAAGSLEWQQDGEWFTVIAEVPLDEEAEP